MIRYIKALLFLVWFGTSHLLAEAQQNLFDYEHTLRFARHLSASGQHRFAADEYERLFFKNPADTTVALEMARNYRLGNMCEQSAWLFGELLKKDNTVLSGNFNREYLRYALHCGVPAGDYFRHTSALPVEEAVFYNLSYYWATQNYNEAIRYNREQRALLEQEYPELYHMGVMYDLEKRKSPAIAALMSAVIPGSGKAYSERWGDAVISLLFVGSNAWASYRAFNKKGVKSVNGWIFGTLAFSFYSSNIWGSAQAAKSYNSEVNQRYQRNAEAIIHHSY